MQDKKRIVIRFNSIREYVAVQEAISEFKKNKKFKNKNEVYLKLIKNGLGGYKVNHEEHKSQETPNIDLEDMKKILILSEAQLRLLFWVMMAKNKPTMEDLQKMDISKLPPLDSLKKLIDGK